jgi:hypothetical protein
MNFAYWIADCKTAGCSRHHVAKIIGKLDLDREYALPAGIPQWFDFRCRACGNRHRYTVDDLRLLTLPSLVEPDGPEWW